MADTGQQGDMARGIALAQAGQTAAAYASLRRALFSEGDAADLRLWLAQVAPTPGERVQHLERAAALEPDHPHVATALAAARAQHPAPPSAAPGSSVIRPLAPRPAVPPPVGTPAAAPVFTSPFAAPVPAPPPAAVNGSAAEPLPGYLAAFATPAGLADPAPVATPARQAERAAPTADPAARVEAVRPHSVGETPAHRTVGLRGIGEGRPAGAGLGDPDGMLVNPAPAASPGLSRPSAGVPASPARRAVGAPAAAGTGRRPLMLGVGVLLLLLAGMAAVLGPPAVLPLLAPATVPPAGGTATAQAVLDAAVAAGATATAAGEAQATLTAAPAATMAVEVALYRSEVTSLVQEIREQDRGIA
ncbi:MAG TPA: hypothetical protein VM536_02400, partial [Chloroflexia bacterium]|nr:hypothetical protein [Chloroflexia bacterium]